MIIKKTPDENFLDAQIALLTNAKVGELDEYLAAAGLNPQSLDERGTNAIKGALTSIQVAKQTSATLAALAPARQKEIASRLQIKRSVFSALSEHRAIVSSIPVRFLKRLADELGAAVDALRLALSTPVISAGVPQYKSDDAPGAPVQVPFEQLLREAAMSEEEIAELMREDG
jgi:hypothetical protein